MIKILVSACLLGMHCRYNGEKKINVGIRMLMDQVTAIPVCPEQLGGLPTPRDPAERRNDRVVTEGGVDVTKQFIKGAQEAVCLAEIMGCKFALLKEGSPSCGSHQIYDGSFQGTKISGKGITTECLEENGIQVFSEDQQEELKKAIEKHLFMAEEEVVFIRKN